MIHKFWDNSDSDPYFQAGLEARRMLDEGQSQVEVGAQISEYLLPYTPGRKVIIESSPTIKGIVNRIIAMPERRNELEDDPLYYEDDPTYLD